MKELFGIRGQMGYPLDNSPSLKQIISEMHAEYQHLTNDSNNTGQSWQVDEYTFSSVIGQKTYLISIPLGDFYKALTVTTVPADSSTHPEYPLEFVEMEHISEEWGWLNQSKGQLFNSSHDSGIIAFYRKITANTSGIYAEIRPVPARVQQYKILFQQTDWFTQAMESTIATLPHSSQRFYLQALVARNLVMAGLVKWSFDDKKNYFRSVAVLRSLEQKIDRYKPAYEQYIASLDNPDVTYQVSWSTGLGLN